MSSQENIVFLATHRVHMLFICFPFSRIQTASCPFYSGRFALLGSLFPSTS